MLTRSTVRVYSNQRTDKYNEDEWLVEYASPRFFRQPKRTVDFVDTDVPHILEAYKEAGVEVSPLCGVMDNVEAPIEQPDSPESDDEVIIEAETTVESDLNTPDKDPRDMAWQTLKKHTRITTGKTPKNKNEALELLGIEVE